MENMLVVRKVADVSGYANLDAAITGVAVGDIFAVGDTKKLLGSTSVLADFANIRDIQFFTKIAGTPSPDNILASVSIPRQYITTYNFQGYLAGTNQVTRLGGITAGTALVIPTTGTTEIVLRNLSYNHAISSQRISVNAVKRSSQTVEAFVDKLVADINAANLQLASPFVTAAKVGTSPNFGIDFTLASTNVDFDIAISGFLEGSLETITVPPVISIGAGADVVAMERDFSRFKGNHGYAELNELWYKQPLEASAGTNYDLASLAWDGISETPTTSWKTSSNYLILAVVDGDATVDPFMKLVANKAVTLAIDIDQAHTDGTDN